MSTMTSERKAELAQRIELQRRCPSSFDDAAVHELAGIVAEILDALPVTDEAAPVEGDEGMIERLNRFADQCGAPSQRGIRLSPTQAQGLAGDLRAAVKAIVAKAPRDC